MRPQLVVLGKARELRIPPCLSAPISKKDQLIYALNKCKSIPKLCNYVPRKKSRGWTFLLIFTFIFA